MTWKKLLPLPFTATHLYLVIILAAVTAVTMTSAVVTYRKALNFAEDSLKLQALGIAVSLDASLKDSGLLTAGKGAGGRGKVFTNIITEGRWQGLAFIALYDHAGLTLLHSNENLIGKSIDDPYIKKVSQTSETDYSYLTLGTGERVFVLDFPVHYEGGDRVLRLALHTYPMEGIIRHAGFNITSMFLVLFILWLVGYFFTVAVARSEGLKREMAERERLAVLGEMSSVLAHEIRNPLGSIKGFAQYLLEHSTRSGREEARGREYLEIIVSESRRLETLTEDLLLYAKPVETRPEVLRLRGLVDDTVQGLRQQASGISFEVSVPVDLEVAADRDKLRQVLINIIRNSMDELPSGGRIEVEARGEGRSVIVTVRDNAGGMDGETLEKVFKPFFTTKTRGTGLGLAIVERLVTAMSGAVSVESAPGKGTTFRLTLPGSIRQ